MALLALLIVAERLWYRAHLQCIPFPSRKRNGEEMSSLRYGQKYLVESLPAPAWVKIMRALG